MIKILTFTPVWQRPEIFEICLQGIKRLMKYDPKRFQVTPFFIVSESWAAQLLNKHKFAYIYHQNQPLGAKKNAGIRYAIEQYDFDYILEIGSDDLIRNEWLDMAEPYLNEQIPQLHPSNVFFADVRTAKTAEWTSQKIIGLGRFISRKAIQQAINKYELWEPQGRRGMDTYSMLQLQRLGIGNKIINTQGEVFTLDLKSDVNINPMTNFSPTNKTFDEIISHFPEAAAISKLNQSLSQSILQ